MTTRHKIIWRPLGVLSCPNSMKRCAPKQSKPQIGGLIQQSETQSLQIVLLIMIQPSEHVHGDRGLEATSVRLSVGFRIWMSEFFRKINKTPSSKRDGADAVALSCLLMIDDLCGEQQTKVPNK